MNSRQRRYWKRQRPLTGVRVVVYDRYYSRYFEGRVSANQRWVALTQVRVDYDNGDYRTWVNVSIALANQQQVSA